MIHLVVENTSIVKDLQNNILSHTNRGKRRLGGGYCCELQRESNACVCTCVRVIRYLQIYRRNWKLARTRSRRRPFAFSESYEVGIVLYVENTRVHRGERTNENERLTVAAHYHYLLTLLLEILRQELSCSLDGLLVGRTLVGERLMSACGSRSRLGVLILELDHEDNCATDNLSRRTDIFSINLL